MDDDRIVPLAVGPGARVVLNSLHRDNDPGHLCEDCVLVGLPGGVFIDVSWAPEHDATGRYFVTVFRHGDWDNPLDVAETRDPLAAGRLVEGFASRYSSE